MKYFRLIWKNVWRKKIRTLLTILSVFVAFLLFSLLSAIGFAFKGGEDVADAERLIVINKISLINPIPMSYQNRILATEGVASVTHASWFGGYYQEPRNQFGQFPVDPQSYFDMYPEFDLPAEQLEAFKRNRTGAIVGEELATTFGWKVGDRIPIQATIWTKADGGRTWEFDIEGIFSTSDARGSTALMLFQYDYFEESRAFAKGTVGWYILRVEPGADPVQVAKAIDLQFANSPNQFYNLLPVLTAHRNVELPLLLTNFNAKERAKRASIALDIVGLGDRAKHYPRELSGGQEQRVAIARAIVSDPSLLLCDEPTGDLDRENADEILKLLQLLNREHGKTIVMVTHDAQAAEYAKRTLHCDKGTLEARVAA